jgi:hypothetical protein
MKTRINNSLGKIGTITTVAAGILAFLNGVNLSEAFYFRFVLIAIFSFVLGNISWSNRLWVKVPAIFIGMVVLPFIVNGLALDNPSNWDMDNIYVYLMFSLGSISYWLSVFVCNILRTQKTDQPETPEER